MTKSRCGGVFQDYGKCSHWVMTPVRAYCAILTSITTKCGHFQAQDSDFF